MIVILTDSSAYLTQAEAQELGAVVMPLTYNMGSDLVFTESFADAGDVDEQVLLQTDARLHTSQITLQSFLTSYEDLIRAGCEVLCLTISSRLSGTYANARMAAQEFHEGAIEVVDSQTTGAALYLLVREARSLIAGGLSLAETAQRLREIRAKAQTVFSVDDLSALRRSGRIGAVKMSVSTILNIKPLLKLENGGVVSAGITRGKQEQIREFLKIVKEVRGEVIVQHFFAEERARHMANMLTDVGYRVTMRLIGPVLGVHLGGGTIGISWME